MKSKLEIKQFLLKNRKLNIDNEIFHINMKYNILGILRPLSMILLFIFGCLLAWMLGTYMYK